MSKVIVDLSKQTFPIAKVEDLVCDPLENLQIDLFFSGQTIVTGLCPAKEGVEITPLNFEVRR